MELTFRILLFLTGLINIFPSILAFLPTKISKSYGIEIPNTNYELLLRHRAALFGLVGGIMIYCAISKWNYELSMFIGFFSMTSFIFLYFLIGKGINAELKKVMQIDVIGLITLSIGSVIYAIFL